MSATHTTTLTRDSYGMLRAICGGGPDQIGQQWQADRDLLALAYQVCAHAERLGLIESEYDTIERDRKGRFSGDALHHEVYDFSLRRSRIHQVLVCVREAVGTKYGVSTTSKTYWILTRVGRGIEIQPASKNTAARAAKQAGNKLGLALQILQGAASLRSNRLDLTTVYKCVEVFPDGRMLSLYDGKTEYVLGVEMREPARQHHGGGYYCFTTKEEAMGMDIKLGPRSPLSTFATLKCAAGGAYCRYDSGKISVSRLTPLEVVA